LIRAALPHMYRQKFGRVINISSVHGIRASEFKVAYVTAKHALEGLSKVTAIEGGPHDVTSKLRQPGIRPYPAGGPSRSLIRPASTTSQKIRWWPRSY